MHIKVNKKHIRRGLRGNPQQCPVALAIKEKTHKSVCVSGYGAKVRYGRTWVWYQLPVKAVAFIRHFDADKSFISCKDTNKIKPFTFELL
jgi:hypothetical protein